MEILWNRRTLLIGYCSFVTARYRVKTSEGTTNELTAAALAGVRLTTLIFSSYIWPVGSFLGRSSFSKSQQWQIENMKNLSGAYTDLDVFFFNRNTLANPSVLLRGLRLPMDRME